MKDKTKVIRLAEELAGGDLVKALDWYYDTKIPSFDYLTANQLVENGYADALIEYLKAGGYE